MDPQGWYDEKYPNAIEEINGMATNISGIGQVCSVVPAPEGPFYRGRPRNNHAPLGFDGHRIGSRCRVEPAEPPTSMKMSEAVDELGIRERAWYWAICLVWSRPARRHSFVAAIRQEEQRVLVYVRR